MTTHRVVFPRPREVVLEPFELEEPGAGQVLVDGEVSLISTGTELTALSGDFPAGSVWARYAHTPCTLTRHAELFCQLLRAQAVSLSLVEGRTLSRHPQPRH
jgi:hypothetical protein